MKRLLKAADLFCGAGGSSTGTIEACQEAGFQLQMTAINHWDIAIATHRANHPTVRHLCENLDFVNPRNLFRERELDILWASPECMSHSVARGGKPVNDQSRATAWTVIRWADALLPRAILVENVQEFEDWGTVGADGKRLKSKLGTVFIAWIRALEALGYRVDWRVLCAADYGDPTRRKRIFVQAVRGRMGITWPEPTHAPAEETDLLGTRKQWASVRNEVIDWSLPSKSVFRRKKPLCDKTMERIHIGYARFGGEPFIVPQHNGYDGKLVDSIDQPLRTLTTTSRGVMLVKPFIISIDHQGGNSDCVSSIDNPLTTVTTKARHCLVQPYLIKYYGTGGGQSIDVPLDTVTCKDRFGLVTPVVKKDRPSEAVDFMLRMLQPHELAKAQGFPAEYQFTGTKTEKVKQIGNAVPRRLAKALVRSVLAAGFS